MFGLFLQGTSCEDIVRLNKGLSLGQIVRARVDNDWDGKRQAHIEGLLTSTRERLQQITLESVEFVSMALAAAHKQFGDQFKRYLQTGNEQDLPPVMTITGLKSYKEAIELLKTLSGQDTKKNTHTGEVIHTHVVEQPLPRANKALSSEEASAAVRLALQSKGLRR